MKEMSNVPNKIPLVLSPAGDMETLKAAISAGADEIYFGTDLFNARMKAKNFTLEEAREAIYLCHAHGVKAIVTLNIAIYDKEIPQLIEYVYSLYSAGADALIVSDLGIIDLICKYLPDFELHASTQCTIHNLDGVRFMNKTGCKRVVLARELSKNDIKYIADNSDSEIEVFVHGAHCMSVSGQCLMSFAMGGRSGNRGQCAQPCRLPYTLLNKKSYPLSLKDMSLSSHITDLISLNVDSFKIEGRLKSSYYVYNATSTFRKLIDERRNASKKDVENLGSVFSRQGFTDGFFVNNIGSSMLGIRTEQNKTSTKETEVSIPDVRKVPLTIRAEFRVGFPSKLTLRDKYREISVFGDVVENAKTAPMSDEDIIKNLSKLGNTPYYAESISIEKDDNIIIRIASLNQLRRNGIDKLLNNQRKMPDIPDYNPDCFIGSDFSHIKTALFSNVSQIPDDLSFFDLSFVYVDRYKKCKANGIAMPPVILDSEWNDIDKLIDNAVKDGIKNVLVTNISQIEHLKKYDLHMFGDFRLNVFNVPCANFLIKSGLKNVMLSPELSLSQCKSMKGALLIAYGKFPVMTTHKCILKDSFGCDKCNGYIKDRTGSSMYCEGISGHRNIIYNSVPIYMADKMNLLSDYSLHFIFTDESKEECAKVIDSYKNNAQTTENIRRIK